MENKSNEFCVFGIIFDFDIFFYLGNDYFEVVVKEVIIKEDENVYLEGKNDNFSGFEICLDFNVFFYLVINFDVVVKKINFFKED